MVLGYTPDERVMVVPLVDEGPSLLPRAPGRGVRASALGPAGQGSWSTPNDRTRRREVRPTGADGSGIGRWGLLGSGTEGEVQERKV